MTNPTTQRTKTARKPSLPMTEYDGVALTMPQARKQILAILAQMPTQNLPRFKSKSGCIWFPNLNMGWSAASNPESLADGEITHLFCGEAAQRELARQQARNQRAEDSAAQVPVVDEPGVKT